ncbi:MAG: response regulator [Desulfobacterales bacterium]|nr:response regulator [Desulfobacterales bacterium]
MNKILVIDDEKPTLTMFRFLLSAYGYSVFTAENGEEGLKILEREKCPLVLTDIKMPGMDGIEVLKRIKEMDPRIEVIVVTGHGDMDLAINALNLDATDFINKPVQREALEQALKRAEKRIQLAENQEKQVWVRSKDNYAVIEIRGRISSHSESYLQKAYKDALAMEKEKIFLRFDENASINGAGIAVLTQILLEGREQGRKIFIAGLSKNFRKVFEIVGISKLVEVLDTIDE